MKSVPHHLNGWKIATTDDLSCYHLALTCVNTRSSYHIGVQLTWAHVLASHKLKYLGRCSNSITGAQFFNVKQGKSNGFDSCDRPSNLTQLDSYRRFFSLGFLWMTLKTNRAALHCYVKLCSTFQSHWWIQTWVTVWKGSIRVEIGFFLSRMTLKYDRWSWKTIGHLS